MDWGLPLLQRSLTRHAVGMPAWILRLKFSLLVFRDSTSDVDCGAFGLPLCGY